MTNELKQQIDEMLREYEHASAILGMLVGYLKADGSITAIRALESTVRFAQLLKKYEPAQSH